LRRESRLGLRMTPDEVDKLIKAAWASRHGLRDALMISHAWHHGLRVSELVDLRWSPIDWKRADIAVLSLSRSTSRIFRMGSLSWGMPSPFERRARHCRFEPYPTGAPIPPQPGRHRSEPVGRHHHVCAVQGDLGLAVCGRAAGAAPALGARLLIGVNQPFAAIVSSRTGEGGESAGAPFVELPGSGSSGERRAATSKTSTNAAIIVFIFRSPSFERKRTADVEFTGPEIIGHFSNSAFSGTGYS
jgi:hypothetical protein